MIATNREEVKQAIGLHGLWKSRLRTAVATGRCDYAAARVSQESECEFGQWLATVRPAESEVAHFERARELHQRFHAEAAHVLRLVESGDREAAGQAIAPGSGFARLTAELTLTLMEWSKAA